MSKKDLESLSIEILEHQKQLDKKVENYFFQLTDLLDSENEGKEKLHNEINTEIASLKRTLSNLKKSYLDISIKTDELETCFREIEASKKNRKLISAPPANSIIDLEEKKKKHFSQGINFYKLFLICFIGSFAGVIVETLWCFITNGYIESRAGLVYGPFNLLYGVGAVILTLVLYKYRNRNSIISFLGGFIVGSIIEYTCSFGQELIFGSTSWDYSNMPFNINGRICLLYSIFWGFLGVFWIKNLYPRSANLMLKIPNKLGKILTCILLIFFIINASITVISVNRWSNRLHGISASNSFENFIDKNFPNDKMSKIFVNMNFN